MIGFSFRLRSVIGFSFRLRSVEASAALSTRYILVSPVLDGGFGTLAVRVGFVCLVSLVVLVCLSCFLSERRVRFGFLLLFFSLVGPRIGSCTWHGLASRRPRRPPLFCVFFSAHRH